ncbi:short-chain dehydrogenase [Cyanobium sp. Morenito 9A2]|uniref:short-chain dehydrogenase n=1 Tax=Cyanobium sp. Morenito 9A2 TaxID=2823718 RepID=UPI0020CBD2E9|nr:short-chain dehydrogenase [Cyanobium sp. Morenito 9A2]MCP9850179.1 short-chain dehydrogenase [Cyanobium sp. Morenito 9A2]
MNLLDALLGRALPLKGRRVAVSGASGSLGRELLQELQRRGAEPIALSSSPEPLVLRGGDGQLIGLEQVQWSCGEESALAPLLEHVDILVINHGLNVHGARSPEAVERSLEVNALSAWRLLELFVAICERQGRPDPASPLKEVWVNTSEAEVQPALSPLYELSKRLLGELLSLRQLDAPGAPWRLRRLVLGPFRSALNPIGVMPADFVARQVLGQASRGLGLIIVTPNPLTYLTMPLAALGRRIYFGLITGPKIGAGAEASRPEPRNPDR